MRELPENKFFEGFYIWFDKDKKEEYYESKNYEALSTIYSIMLPSRILFMQQ